MEEQPSKTPEENAPTTPQVNQNLKDAIIYGLLAVLSIAAAILIPMGIVVVTVELSMDIPDWLAWMTLCIALVMVLVSMEVLELAFDAWKAARYDRLNAAREQAKAENPESLSLIWKKAWIMLKGKRWAAIWTLIYVDIWIPHIVPLGVAIIWDLTIGRLFSSWWIELLCFYIVITLLLMPICLKKTWFFLKVAKNQEADIVRNSLSDRFFFYLWVVLRQKIFIWLWSLLFIVPGIIAAYRYFLTDYLIWENPKLSEKDVILSAKDAMNKSCEMMKGYKLKLLGCQLIMFGMTVLFHFAAVAPLVLTGLDFLAVIFGIIVVALYYLVMIPYFHSVYAQFYLAVKARFYSRNNGDEASVSGPALPAAGAAEPKSAPQGVAN